MDIGFLFGWAKEQGIKVPTKSDGSANINELFAMYDEWKKKGGGKVKGDDDGKFTSSGGSAKSSRTDVDEKARNFLEKQGIDRYSRLERPQGIAPATEVTYGRLLGVLESGGEIDEKLSPATARKIASLARYNQAIAAKRILTLDSTENPQRELDYFDYHGEIAAFAENAANGGQKSARKTEGNRKMTEEERKKKEAIDYFKAHYDPNRPQREITSDTYKRAQARSKRDVENFLGRGLT